MILNNKIDSKPILTTVILILSIFGSFAGNIELISGENNDERPHITVVTNRPFLFDSITGEYFPNKISTDNELSYMKVKNQSGNWQVQKIESINSIQSSDKSLQDWLVYVHGDSQTPELAFERGFQIQEEYRVNVLVFSWPSKDPKFGGIRNFKNSVENIRNGVHSFVRFIIQLDSIRNLQDSRINGNLSLFLHSLGNYYLESMVSDSLITWKNKPVFVNVIINAAAVNQNEHHVWLDKIRFQERVYVNLNSRDIILKGVTLFSSADTQLGVNAGDQYASNSSYISFTKVLEKESDFRFLHGYYVGYIPGKYPNIFRYYYELFHGAAPELLNPEAFVRQESLPVYEIIN